jgi:hypothetical protein
MLLKLTPSQVSKYWVVLSEGIRASLFPTVKDKSDTVNGFLVGIMSGRMECWVYYDKGMLVGMVVTSTLHNIGTNMRYLTLEAVYAFRMTNKRIWADAVSKLIEFARSQKCSAIVSLTYDRRIVRLSEILGFSSDCKMAFLEV